MFLIILLSRRRNREQKRLSIPVARLKNGIFVECRSQLKIVLYFYGEILKKDKHYGYNSDVLWNNYFHVLQR